MRLHRVLMSVCLLAPLSAAAAAFEVGDQVAVLAETNLTGDGTATEKLPPGMVLTVSEVQATRLRVTATISGWIDISAAHSLAEANDFFTKAVRKNPDDLVSVRALGNVRWALGEFEDAMMNLCHAICLRPDDSLAHRWRARVLRDARLYSLALPDACAAVRLRPDDPLAWMLRGSIRGCLGKATDGLSDFDAAIKLNAAYAGPLSSYGDVLAGQKDYEAAIASYTKAIERDPRDARAYLGRAACYLCKGLDDPVLMDKGLADLQTAVRVNPKYPRAYGRLACYYLYNRDLNRRDIPQAIKLARTACELSQWRDAGMIATLADAYRAGGDTSQAVELRITALRVAMAETSRVANWQFELHFNHCTRCNLDEVQCRCEHPRLAPPLKTTPAPPATR